MNPDPKETPFTCARLCCANYAGDSLPESSMIAGSHEHLGPCEVQDQELATAQHSTEATRIAFNLVSSGDGLDATANGQTWAAATIQRCRDQTCLTLNVLFGMPLRQATGFVESLLRLWAVPDFSTLCRRQKTLNVSLPFRGRHRPAEAAHRQYRHQVGRRRGNGMLANTAARSAGYGARYT